MPTEVGNIHCRKEGCGEGEDVGGGISDKRAVPHLFVIMQGLDTKVGRNWAQKEVRRLPFAEEIALSPGFVGDRRLSPLAPCESVSTWHPPDVTNKVGSLMRESGAPATRA